MMKITLTLLMFSLNLVYALELDEVNVVLPLGLSQLDKAPLKKGASEIKYKVKIYHNTNQNIIPIKKRDTKSLEGFMSSLVFSYKNQDLDLFKSLMNPKSAKTIDFDSEKFKNSFAFLKRIKKPHIKYAYEHLEGYILSWSAIGLLTERILYLKRVQGNFKMFDLASPKDDHKFWNLGLYFKFGPFDIYSPQSVNAKKFDGNYKINLKINGFKNWIYIYSPTDKKRNIIAVADNYANNKQYKDYDLNARAMELKINSKKLKSMGKEIRVVESSYPLENITNTAHKKSIKIKLP